MIEGIPGTARVRARNSTNESWTDLQLELSDFEISIAEFASKKVSNFGNRKAAQDL